MCVSLKFSQTCDNPTIRFRKNGKIENAIFRFELKMRVGYDDRLRDRWRTGTNAESGLHRL